VLDSSSLYFVTFVSCDTDSKLGLPSSRSGGRIPA
jgi:hypothetical protein